MLNSFRTHKSDLLSSYDTPIYDGNFITVHKILEYFPEYYWDIQKNKDSMRFIPKRDEYNTLPAGMTIILEEASMLDILFSNILAKALVKGTIQLIILGDINQLPPVFGDSILNYALKYLEVIELTEVYRQALDSPIIRQAHRILAGNAPVEDTENFMVCTLDDTAVGDSMFGKLVADALHKLYNKGSYDYTTDMVLSPYNKHGAGTDMINYLIATWIDKLPEHEARPVYEIIAGFNKHYYALGDRVYDGNSKMEGVVTAININGTYFGKSAQAESKHMTRFGHMIVHDAEGNATDNNGTDGADAFAVSETSLAKAQSDYDYSALDLDNATAQEVEDRVLSGSHIIEVLLEDGTITTLATARELNNLTLGYALTTHKAQGCEWPRVIVLTHNTHKLTNREWLYTAITRSQNHCIIFASSKVLLQRIVARQRVKGDSIQDKIANFNSKLEQKMADGDAPIHPTLLDCVKVIREDGAW